MSFILEYNHHVKFVSYCKFILIWLFFFQELLAAKKHFEIIVVEHKTVVFPLAYLGTGRVFYKQNRYEMVFQNHLSILDAILIQFMCGIL